MNANSAVGAEAILDILDSYGVDYIFSSPGSEWPPIWEALAKRRATGKEKPYYINCRHEVLAVCAAIAYQRVTGKLPAVLLHTTVGTLNGSMAIRMAYREQVPMVVLAGGSSTFGEGEIDPGPQWLRFLADPAQPSRLVEPFVKWTGDIINAETFVGTLRHACELALSQPQGPTFVYVPLEIMLQQIRLDSMKRRDTRHDFSPSSELLLEASELILHSRSPIIITECAGGDPNAFKRLVEFAETFAIPVVETHGTVYMNFPRDHPLHLGFDPKPYLNDVDLILLVGVKAPWYPPSKWPMDKTRVVLIDEDPIKSNVPYWNYNIDLTLAGSLAITLTELIKSARSIDSAFEKSGKPIFEERLDRCRKTHDENLARWKSEAREFAHQKPIDLRWIHHELARVIPTSAIVIDELGTDRTVLNQLLLRTEPGTFYSGHFGGLGTGLSYALGVKLFSRNRLVVSIMGDGAFNYNPVLPCFGFAQEYETPILVVILNNGVYGSQERSLLRRYPDGFAAKTGIHYGAKIEPVPNYVEIAKAFGAYGKKVVDPDEIGNVLGEAIERVNDGQMALVDVMVKSQ
ncbi:MAG: thiamine pyrophosphate-binding protein [Nitrososphaerales archaeon]